MNTTRITTSHVVTTTTAAKRTGVLYPLFGAAFLGLSVFYGVAFADSPLAHNAAHDVRHVTVKPCH